MGYNIAHHMTRSLALAGNVRISEFLTPRWVLRVHAWTYRYQGVIRLRARTSAGQVLTERSQSKMMQLIACLYQVRIFCASQYFVWNASFSDDPVDVNKAFPRPAVGQIILALLCPAHAVSSRTFTARTHLCVTPHFLP